MEGFYCLVQLPSGKLYHRQMLFFLGTAQQSLDKQVATKDIPVRYCENIMHHEADWPLKLVVLRVFEISMHSKLEQKYLWVILSNFKVIPIFVVNPVLSKSLYQVEIPSNQIISWIYDRSALGQLKTLEDFFTKSDVWDKVTCVLLWVCNIFRITLNLPEQCFQTL